MANRACAKKILDCAQMVQSDAECLKDTIRLRVIGKPDLTPEEIEKPAAWLAEAAKLVKTAMEVLAKPLE